MNKIIIWKNVLQIVTWGFNGDGLKLKVLKNFREVTIFYASLKLFFQI